MSNDMGVNSPLSTPWGQNADPSVHTVTAGNSVPNAVKSGTFLAEGAGRKGYLSGSGTLLIGPHKGTSLVEWALKYAKHGYYVFPLREGSKFPLKNCQACDDRSDYYERDKHTDGDCTVHVGPSTCHGHKAATRDESTIRGWWMLSPFCNIGINVGRSGIAVLDVDTREKEDGTRKVGEETIAGLQEAHGVLPDGPRVTTWSGGWQRYLTHPQGLLLKSSAGSDTHMTGLGQDVDIKALSAYAVAPPSLVTGKNDRIVQGQYTWATPAWDELPLVPAWIPQVIKEREASKRPARTYSERPWSTDPAPAESVRNQVDKLADEVARASEGARNNLLNKNAFMAFQYAAADQIDPDEVEFIFTQAGCAADPRDTAQVERTVASARNGASNKPYTWRTRGNTTGAAAREGQDVTETADIPEQRSETPSGTFYSNPDAPMKVARDLEHLWTTAQGKTLYHWRETWMQYTGTHWAEVGVSTIKSRLYLKLEDALYLTISKKGEPETKPWNPNIGKIANLVEAISAVTHLDDRVETGTWLGRDGEKGLISCKNVMVNPITRVTHGHTPAYFTTTSVPYAYDPDAGCAQWLAFLGEVFGDDTEAIEAIQEWAGYVLSGRTDLQKGIQLIGPPRSGKGTIARILERLIGKENATGTTLGDIGRQFGLAAMVGKSLCVIGDAHMENRSMAAIVTRLLMIMGEDTIQVDRKNRSEWEGKMSARMMMLANKPPKFSDASGAIVDRWITVKFTKSFLGKEDPTLEMRIAQELPGIFNWALDGLKRLTERGWFVQPESGTETMRSQRENASPVKAFVEERAVVGESHWIVKAALFQAWKDWCLANNVQAVGTTAQFATDLYAATAGVKDGKQKRIGGTPMRCFAGITLRTPEGMMTPATQSEGKNQ